MLQLVHKVFLLTKLISYGTLDWRSNDWAESLTVFAFNLQLLWRKYCFLFIAWSLILNFYFIWSQLPLNEIRMQVFHKWKWLRSCSLLMVFWVQRYFQLIFKSIRRRFIFHYSKQPWRISEFEIFLISDFWAYQNLP